MMANLRYVQMCAVVQEELTDLDTLQRVLEKVGGKGHITDEIPSRTITFSIKEVSHSPRRDTHNHMDKVYLHTRQ